MWHPPASPDKHIAVSLYSAECSGLAYACVLRHEIFQHCPLLPCMAVVCDGVPLQLCHSLVAPPASPEVMGDDVKPAQLGCRQIAPSLAVSA